MVRYEKLFYFTLVISVLLILLIAGKHFLMVILTALGLWFGRKISEEEKKVEDEIKAQHRSQAELLKRAEELTYRFDRLKKSSKRRREGSYKIICLLITIVSFGTMTAGITLAADDLYIPESYEELRELYILADREIRERDELITEYQALVEDYENSLRELTVLVTRLQEISLEKEMIIAVKDEIIAAYKKPAWGVNSGLIVGEKTGYTLGIIRRQDWWGWSINYSPSGLLAFGLSIYF